MVHNCFVGNSLEMTHEEDSSELMHDNFVDVSLYVTIGTFEDDSSKFIHGSIRDCFSALENGAFEDSSLAQNATICEDRPLSLTHGTHEGSLAEEFSFWPVAGCYKV